MRSYLSVDLDYWKDHNTPGAATRFFKKIMNLKVPITVFVEHEEMLSDIHKTKKLDRLYNVDYHSDIISQKDVYDEPEDYDWANFVKGRTKADFIWCLPDYEVCYEKEEGTCHGPLPDPFKYQRKSGWKSCTIQKGINKIDWNSIERIGVCLSPCFVKLQTIRNVIDLLKLNYQDIETLVKNQPDEHNLRTRRTLKNIAA